MTRVRIKFVQAFVDRKTGVPYFYFRKPGSPRVRLRGLPGSTEFMSDYRSALDETKFIEIGATARSTPGSVALAVAAYYGSPAFTTLAPGTRATRRSILERFRNEHGTKPIGSPALAKFLSVMLSTMKPHAARNTVKALRHLMQFAITIGLREDDPTAGIKLPRLAKSDGYYTWSETDIEAFEAAYPVGSKQRLALALGLYTAQRRGDVIRMGPQHVRNGVLTVKQAKTGTTLVIPVHTELQRIIDATPCGHLTFLVTRSGRPYSASDFTASFRSWADAAELPKTCSFHGLRKAACRRLAEAGCTLHEIAAISGHASLREIERYTRKVDQQRMARNAMARRRA